MTKWEYGILDARMTTGELSNAEYWAPRRFKGVELERWNNVRFSSFIDDLGRDGWELVGISHSSPQDEYWVFKGRQLSP